MNKSKFNNKKKFMRVKLKGNSRKKQNHKEIIKNKILRIKLN